MKLEKNNKYSKRIASGIASFLLASSILFGCGSVNAFTEDAIEEVVGEVEEDEVDDFKESIFNSSLVKINDKITDNGNDKTVISGKEKTYVEGSVYYLDDYKISEEEKESRLKKLDIKYPFTIHNGTHIKTLIVNDNNQYKIIPAIDLWTPETKKVSYFDLFTEEKLFDYPRDSVFGSNAPWNRYGELEGWFKLGKIENAIPYFADKEIVEYGECYYMLTFFDKHLKEFSERDNVNYKTNVASLLSKFYKFPIEPSTIDINVHDYAEYYVTMVPLENQVTSIDLGLKSTNRLEDKYFDFWKQSDEQIENKMHNLEIVDPAKEMLATEVEALIIRDENGLDKIMNVVGIINNNMASFYDLYSDIHLFDAKINGELVIQQIEGTNMEYKGIDFTNLIDAIPYFENKEIIKFGSIDMPIYYIDENLKYYTEKAGIEYRTIEGTYYHYLLLSDNAEYSIEEYARTYLRVVPEDLQVTKKDLRMGLDLDKVKIDSK